MADTLSVEQQYPLTDETDTLTDKDWAGGSRECEEVKELTVPRPGEAAIVAMRYPPRFTKMADELVVNALDHILRMIGTSTPVTAIRLTFNPTDGSITVFNDGAGIPAVLHADASAKYGRPMYVPEFILGVLFQGSNRDRADNCIIGGTNGVGVKLVNANSTQFTVETVDTVRGVHYAQTWKNHMRNTTPPTITPLASYRGRKPVGTTIRYWPDWAYLNLSHPSTCPATCDMVSTLLRTRCATAAVYAQFATRALRNHPTVTYEYVPPDGQSKPVAEQIRYKTTADLAQSIYPGAPSVSMRVYATEELDSKGKPKQQCVQYCMDWEATIVITEVKKDCDSLTVINGVVARDGGHIARVRDIVNSAVLTELKGKINESDMKRAKNLVKSNTFIVLYCQIPNPGWEGQRKDRLSQKKPKFSHYTVEPKATKAITKLLTDMIVDTVTGGATRGPSGIKSPPIPLDVYQPALATGKKSVRNKRIAICEGSSAKSGIKSMGLDPNVWGVLALGGVIVNARRETEVFDSGDAKQYVKQNDKFVNNKMMRWIMDIFGLDIGAKYTASSIPNLPLDGGGVLFVDQDMDGKGFILGLFISLFAKLWPGLLSAGYIGWFETPIIRAFPTSGGKGKIIEQFYRISEYDAWAARVGNDINKYRITYYKGLARHKPEDWKDMARTLDQHIYKYSYDPAKHDEWFEVYFGNIPAKRREVLRKPPYAPTEAELNGIIRTRKIPCDLHMRTETHEYQLDNLERKLPHVIDGQTQGSRKIIHAALTMLTATAEPRVAQFAADVTKTQDYHHGEASLENSLFCRMQIYAGGVQLPLIRPSGMAGSRQKGGGDHGSARYVHVRSNARLTRLLFPDADYHMLDFNIVDGETCEPKYFVPIVPLAVCESTHLPAHGWKVELWARDLLSVVNRVRSYIANDGIKNFIGNIMELPAYEYRDLPEPYTGRIVGDVSYGKYTYQKGTDSDVVYITELPLRVWTIGYISRLQARSMDDPDNIISVADTCRDVNKVGIRVEVASGLMESIAAENGISVDEAIISYFHLASRMTNHINLMSPDGGVAEYGRYADVVNSWYPYRKDLYIRRCERISVIYSLQVRMYENICRYVRESASLGLSKQSIAQMEARLASANYDRFYRAIVNDPKFTPTADIVHIATQGDRANYDYLIDLRDRDKSAESLAKYEAKLDGLKREAAAHDADCRIGAFRGAHIWRKELDQLVAVYKEGITTDWTFGEQREMTYG